MSRRWGAAALAVAVWSSAGWAQAQTGLNSAYPTPRELRAIEAPPVPHEAQPDRWPQPDYFQLALQLTPQRAPDPAALPRLSEGGPALAVLPVQTEAFGFAPELRALLGAELDRLLAARGIEALSQIDAVDVRGPTVRRFDEAAIAALLEQQPRRRLVMLHAGHDGIDRLFLTLVVRDRQGQVVQHRSLTLPDEPLAAWRAASGVLPELIASAGLKGGAAPPAQSERAEACSAAHWSLEPLAAAASVRQQACQALVVGTLLPDFSRPPALWPSFDLRLAWLARAFVLAAADAADDPAAAALQSLAWRQIGLGRTPQAEPPADDPVLPRIARLLALPLAGRAPVQSAREARTRQSAEIGRDLPAFAAAAVGYRAEFVDLFGAIDLCELERLLPGSMPRPACRLEGADVAPIGGVATAAQKLLFQAWRLAAAYKELDVVGHVRGQPARGEAVAAAMPQDLAQHPLMQRLRLEAVDAPERATSFDAQLALVRSMTERSLANTVALQRRDQWLQGFSISEHSYVRSPAIWTDERLQELREDETRLLGVLRFDRFGPADLAAPDRRAEGDPALFLVPQRRQLAALRAQWARVNQERNPPAQVAPAPLPSGMFGASRSPATIEALTARLERNPLDMQARVQLGVVRLKHGAPLAEVVALFNARPENARLDDRVQESHALALPAHALFLSGEHEAARPFYEKVVRLGTGSESELHARARLQQIAGRWPQYLEEARQRLRRYDSDFARHDVAGLLFMSGQPERAWELLEPRLATSEVLYLWNAVQVGHRLEGAGLAQMQSWVGQRKLDQVLINSTVIDRHYLHLMAVVDRLPTDTDIPRLLPVPSLSVLSGEYRWSVSALLTQAALGVGDLKTVLQRSRLSLSPASGDKQRFLLPNFAWVAWQATQGQDEMLDEVRRTGLDADFDGLIAKAMLMALDGRTAESMQFMAAARYELSLQGTTSLALLDRPLPAPYQYAFAGYLMHRQTGREEYRRETLRFVRAQQHLTPFYAWLHAIEAALETAPAARTAAACRARALDPGSYFLAQAGVPGLDDKRCKPYLWQASSR